MDEMLGDYVAVTDILNQSVKESVAARKGMAVVLAYVLPIHPGQLDREIREARPLSPDSLGWVRRRRSVLNSCEPALTIITHSQDDVPPSSSRSGARISPPPESSRACQASANRVHVAKR
jgi:hypothetical protein